MLAAWLNAISRCSPRVVPVLPPTGAAGVGSLKPTPGALRLTMTNCAGPATAGAAAATRLAAANSATPAREDDPVVMNVARITGPPRRGRGRPRLLRG